MGQIKKKETCENHFISVIKMFNLEKTIATKLRQFKFYFWWIFVLFHQGIIVTVTFNMLLYTFIKKNQNVKQQSNSVVQTTLMGKT